MNLPSYTIRSSARLSAAACLAAALLLGCGGTAGPTAREYKHALEHPDGSVTEDADNGGGHVTFQYANKSTEAHLDVDLGSSDLYLEMTGMPTHHDAAPPEAGPQAKRPASPSESQQPESGEPPQPPSQEQSQQPHGRQPPGMQPPTHKDPSQPPPEEDQGGNEDVTTKVLQGIRKAQELFYQKRYPEALQMVRQSLDAQPTAEGHALAGSICYMMSQNGLARRHWQEALRLNPDMPAVVNMLERTRTPGGRGSPSPRPLASRPAARAAPAPVMDAARAEPAEQAPFPEVEGESAPAAAPVPAATPAPAPVPAPTAATAPVPAPAAVSAPAAKPNREGKANPPGNPEVTPASTAPPRPSAKHVATPPAAARPPAPGPKAAAADSESDDPTIPATKGKGK